MHNNLNLLSTERLIDLSMKINEELHNREYQMPLSDEITEQDLSSLENQLLK